MAASLDKEKAIAAIPEEAKEAPNIDFDNEKILKKWCGKSVTYELWEMDLV